MPINDGDAGMLLRQRIAINRVRADLDLLRYALWWLMMLAAILVAALNLRFVWQGVPHVFHRAIDHLGHRDFELYLHLYTAPFILIAGPLMFVRSLRVKYPRLHRWAGRVYIAVILVTAIATLRLSLNETEGPLTVFGFATLSVLWFATAAMAWIRAVQGQWEQHRDWMIRNYALTLTNVTFRIQIHLLLWLGAPWELVYEPLRSLQFVPNLLVAELLIQWDFLRMRDA